MVNDLDGCAWCTVPDSYFTGKDGGYGAKTQADLQSDFAYCLSSDGVQGENATEGTALYCTAPSLANSGASSMRLPSLLSLGLLALIWLQAGAA